MHAGERRCWQHSAQHCPRIHADRGAEGELHLVARLPDTADEASVLRAARARGLAVSPLAAYFSGTPRLRGLVMGFATTPTALAAECARRLAAAVNPATPWEKLQVAGSTEEYAIICAYRRHLRARRPQSRCCSPRRRGRAAIA